MELLRNFMQLSPWIQVGLLVSPLIMAWVAYANSCYDPRPKTLVILQGAGLGVVLAAAFAGVAGYFFGATAALCSLWTEVGLLVLVGFVTRANSDPMACRPGGKCRTGKCK